MHDIAQRIADVLLEVEAHLRINGQWDENQPSESALASAQPFCTDTLKFEQWLQWVFLPRMKKILEQQQPLPQTSSIYVYAQNSLPGKQSGVSNLLTLIKRFDDLISTGQGPIRH